MTPHSPDAAVVAAVARSIGMFVLLLPIAVAAGWWFGAGRDRALAFLAGTSAAVCAVAIGGLVLSSFAGVSLTGWLAVLAIVDLFLAVVAARHSGAGDRFVRDLARTRRRMPRTLPALISAAAVALVVGSVLVSIATAQRQEQRVHFTQLWMVPVSQAGTETAEIGVDNLEGRTTSYRITVSGGGATLFSAPLRLGASRSWTATVRLPAATPRELITTTLYRGSSPVPYRVTNLWSPGG